MIIPDVNLLVYAVFDGYGLHQRAATWLTETINGSEEFGLTTPTIFGFVRIGTSGRVHEHPLTMAAAAAYVHEWLGRPQTKLLAPGREHVRLTMSLLEGLGTGANLTTDAQLAAFALEFNAVLHSNDSDFGRFPGITWVNPLT